MLMNTAQALVNIDARNWRPQVSARCGFRSVFLSYWMRDDKVTDYGGSNFLCYTSKQLPDYTALHGRRPHTFILLPYCQELTEGHYYVSQVASQTVPRDGRPLFQSAVSRGPRMRVQCAAGKTMFSVTILKSKCRRRLAPARRHVSRLPNTLCTVWQSLN